MIALPVPIIQKKVRYKLHMITSGFIALLMENCTENAYAICSNPVKWEFQFQRLL